MKQVLPQTLSPPGSTPWTQHQRDQPSPTSSLSLGSISPGAYSPCRTLDTSGSSASFSSDQPQQKAHHWKNGPVEGWSNDQVGAYFLIYLKKFSQKPSLRFVNGCTASAWSNSFKNSSNTRLSAVLYSSWNRTISKF